MFKNGQIPAERLVQLDSGHWSSPASAERWYAFRAAVKDRAGVTLRITPGPNAYRSYADQQQTRRDACARGNCLQAASPGTSPHGGTWSHWRWTGGRTVDAMAFDVDNWWAVSWSVFQEEAERVGFQVGTIRADVAGVDEWWHIVDLDPWAPVLTGGQEDDMGLLPDERAALMDIKSALLDGIPGRDLSVGRLKQLAEAVFDIQSRMYITDPETGKRLWDAFDELTQKSRTILSTVIQIAKDSPDVDEKALAAELAPLLSETVGVMSDEQLADLAERIVTIQGQRMLGGAKS